mmetsp:Transcript_5826/g.16867  ORF Transcript_5826/g.16867 Transcript_5826/m.16867 type:complete len:464 (+) Transcript_5826:620-2011(+)
MHLVQHVGILDHLEVVHHVRVEDGLDAESPALEEVVPPQGFKDIRALRGGEDLEHRGAVHVLQGAAVVVAHGEVVADLDEEGVVETGVPHVMAHRRHQQRELLQPRQKDVGLRQQHKPPNHVQDVDRVHECVERQLGLVVATQCVEEGTRHLRRWPNLLEHGGVLQENPVCDRDLLRLLDLEHVELPRVDDIDADADARQAADELDVRERVEVDPTSRAHEAAADQADAERAHAARATGSSVGAAWASLGACVIRVLVVIICLVLPEHHLQHPAVLVLQLFHAVRIRAHNHRGCDAGDVPEFLDDLLEDDDLVVLLLAVLARRQAHGRRVPEDGHRDLLHRRQHPLQRPEHQVRHREGDEQSGPCHDAEGEQNQHDVHGRLEPPRRRKVEADTQLAAVDEQAGGRDLRVAEVLDVGVACGGAAPYRSVQRAALRAELALADEIWTIAELRVEALELRDLLAPP